MRQKRLASQILDLRIESENKMAQPEDPRQPEVPKSNENEGPIGTVGEESIGLASRWCAYNQTRQRFVSTRIEKAGFSPADLDECLTSLTPGSVGAVWIVPSRYISPASVRAPLDLLYLDRNYRVIDAVESFPISPDSPSSTLAASILVLPADAIASGKISPGDCLIVCTPEKMKQRLHEMAGETNAATRNGDSARDKTDQGAEDELRATFDADRQTSAGKSPGGVPHEPEFPSPVLNAPIPPENTTPFREPGKGKKNWLRRLLWGDPPEPRRTSRESLSWLAVYFFTGGTPVAHAVRDVSLTGLYVLTEERWYLGTLIRMTLTDRRDPSADRSITLNAKVVRWGADGVGLEFVLQDDKTLDACMTGTPDERFVQVSKVKVEEFLRRIKSGTR